MPANLTPDYKAAEARFRAARTLDEKRRALEEMLSKVPKHKGTEKIQADIKRRLARLRDEERSKSGRHGHSVRVEPEGAAQVVLLGPPNCGKSSLLKAVTRAEPHIGEYPFTTTQPQPGMMPFEDTQIQLVDLPPVTREHMDSWLPDVARGADAALLLADPGSPALPADVEEVRERLAAVRVHLAAELPAAADYRDTYLRTMLVLTKAATAAAADLAALEGLYRGTFPLLRVDARSGAGLEGFKKQVWSWLHLVRVYAKPPGKPVDHHAPFVLHHGATVIDLAEKIHRELAHHLQFARVWGGERQGLRVARDFELRDGDAIELHF